MCGECGLLHHNPPLGIMASMWQRRWLRNNLPQDGLLLPVLATGLFAGRLLSEIARAGVAGAVLITAFALVGAWLLIHRLPASLSWSTVALLLYVVYPDPDPRVAVGAAALTAAIGWQTLVTPAPSVIRVLPGGVFFLAGGV